MTTTEVKVLDEQGTDQGYLRTRQNWWFDPTFPHAFELFDLDAFYEESYYATDHVSHDTVCAYVDAVLQYGARLLGRPVQSVLECGCAGGWFTEEFVKRGVDVFAVEGSRAGVKRTLSRGVPTERLRRHDLRRPLQLDRRFDVAICTEVAEHVECPFSGQLVQNLVSHSDLVWFSFEEPDTNEAHYHHSNEQPAKFWLNLFRFYDYRVIELPAEVGRIVGDRGTHIFCAPNINIPGDVHVSSNGHAHSAASFGSASSSPGPKHDLKYWLKQLSPPIGITIARSARAALRKRGIF
jgi:SAM-dependent methyltransferase